MWRIFSEQLHEMSPGTMINLCSLVIFTPLPFPPSCWGGRGEGEKGGVTYMHVPLLLENKVLSIAGSCSRGLTVAQEEI